MHVCTNSCAETLGADANPPYHLVVNANHEGEEVGLTYPDLVTLVYVVFEPRLVTRYVLYLCVESLYCEFMSHIFEGARQVPRSR